MTPYRFDNNQKKQKKSRTYLVMIASIFVLIIMLMVVVLPRLLGRVSRGPLGLGSTVLDSAQQGIAYAIPKSLLLKENASLKQSLAEQQAEHAELMTLRADYAALQEQVHYYEPGTSFRSARVIAKPSQSLLNSMILDQGSEEGIRVGHVVVAQKNLGIGKVVQVTPHTSTVELFAGPEFNGDVNLARQSLTVPAHGKGGGNFELEIPREIEVTDGDVLTFPDRPHIVIGVIKSVQFDPRDPFQTVLARAPINVQTLRFVQVVE